jgi:hypothetical protein
MDITNWLLLVGTTLALVSLTWYGCAWWYGRKLKELHERLLKTRQAAGKHATQARRQIAQLQKDLAARTSVEAVQRQAAMAEAERRSSLIMTLDDEAPMSRLPLHGFADTQPL